MPLSFHKCNLVTFRAMLLLVAFPMPWALLQFWCSACTTLGENVDMSHQVQLFNNCGGWSRTKTTWMEHRTADLDPLVSGTLIVGYLHTRSIIFIVKYRHTAWVYANVICHRRRSRSIDQCEYVSVIAIFISIWWHTCLLCDLRPETFLQFSHLRE